MKQCNEIDNALRELATLRDRQLGAAPSLSPPRRAVLTGFLAVRFPLETALREVAMRRDQSLDADLPKIPVLVESALHRQLLAAESARGGAGDWRASGWNFTASIWHRIFRSPLGTGLAACAVTTAAVVWFGWLETPPRRSAPESLPQAAEVSLQPAVTSGVPSIGRVELFSRRIALGPFNLNTSEPASLETAFVSNRRIQLADGIATPLGLRLDLPVRATLLEDGFARIP